jgi:hypothetical protein
LPETTPACSRDIAARTDGIAAPIELRGRFEEPFAIPIAATRSAAAVKEDSRKTLIFRVYFYLQSRWSIARASIDSCATASIEIAATMVDGHEMRTRAAKSRLVRVRSSAIAEPL